MWFNLIVYTPMYITGFWALLLLLLSRGKNRAKFFLGLFMVLAFGLYFAHALFFQKEYATYLFFDPIYIFTSLSVYPMYYWYIKLLTVESEIKWSNLKLFAPALTLGLATLTIYLLMTPNERMHYLISHLFSNSKIYDESKLISIQHILFIISRFAFLAQVITFLLLGRKLVVKYNSLIENFYSNLESKTILWVNFLLYSFFITSIVSIIFNFLGRSMFLGSNIFLLIPSLIFSVLLFFIGFQGHMQNYTVTDLAEEEQNSPELTVKEYNQIQLKEKLLELFEIQQIFRQNDLKITHLSRLLQTNRTYISILINTEFGSTFSDFVNKYRVEEAKKLLADSKQKNYSLDSISEKSGFGSINSFIRIFKEKVGTTPGKFRDVSFLSNK